jgi:hypothetical protein
MGLVDAVVDDADLDPVSRGGELRAPERRSTDESRRGRAERVVGDARVDTRDAVHVLERRELTLGDHEREPVDDEGIAALDREPVDLVEEPRGNHPLGNSELTAIRRGPYTRQRRSVQGDHYFNERTARRRRESRRTCERRKRRKQHDREEGDPLQNGHGS